MHKISSIWKLWKLRKIHYTLGNLGKDEFDKKLLVRQILLE
ncbi:6034_t:CDS:2, partial [Rhizophagus irregularis]